MHGISAVVYENELGGRVAVFGYYPWNMIHNSAKPAQLKAVCRWLSYDRFPAYIASNHKIAIWCRRDTSGKLALLLLNVSADAANDAVVHLQGNGSQIQLVGMNGESTTLSPAEEINAYSAYCIAHIALW